MAPYSSSQAATRARPIRRRTARARLGALHRAAIVDDQRAPCRSGMASRTESSWRRHTSATSWKPTVRSASWWKSKGRARARCRLAKRRSRSSSRGANTGSARGCFPELLPALRPRFGEALSLPPVDGRAAPRRHSGSILWDVISVEQESARRQETRQGLVEPYQLIGMEPMEGGRAHHAVEAGGGQGRGPAVAPQIGLDPRHASAIGDGASPQFHEPRVNVDGHHARGGKSVEHRLGERARSAAAIENVKVAAASSALEIIGHQREALRAARNVTLPLSMPPRQPARPVDVHGE
jgi:hypothetical protein